MNFANTGSNPVSTSMIKLEKGKDGDNRWYLNFGESAFIHTINDWEQVFGKWNWYTFTLIKIEFENDTNFAQGIEFEFVLLGLGFRFRYNKPEFLKKCEEWDKKAEESVAKRKGI